ncbi:hypothetical protein FGO68_gene9218 [Halteria grandinella]|uniref:Uncharacterized protein n=1 Tax=Halteria grandinella TaxID=5974 RepID=A0A8J8NMV5_HALGN|nr:hypothetical protein FGO68_gene9218 [Halteria grandinella]
MSSRNPEFLADPRQSTRRTSFLSEMGGRVVSSHSQTFQNQFPQEVVSRNATADHPRRPSQNPFQPAYYPGLPVAPLILDQTYYSGHMSSPNPHLRIIGVTPYDTATLMDSSKQLSNGKQIIIQNEEPQIRRLYRQEPSKTEYVVISKLQEANQQKLESERNIIFQPMIKVISKHMCKAHGRKMMYFSLERKVFLCDICEKGEEALYIMEQLHMPASDLYYPLHDLLIGDTDFLQDIQNTFQYYKEHNLPFNPSGVQDALNQLYLEIKKAALNFKDIQRSYLALLTTGNFEELLIQHGTWSSQIYDFQSKFLDPQQLKQSIDTIVDPLIRQVSFDQQKCYICLKDFGKDTAYCNNIKDEECRVCKGCAKYCMQHGYYCRVHSHKQGCTICQYQFPQHL